MSWVVGVSRSSTTEGCAFDLFGLLIVFEISLCCHFVILWTGCSIVIDFEIARNASTLSFVGAGSEKALRCSKGYCLSSCSFEVVYLPGLRFGMGTAGVATTRRCFIPQAVQQLAICFKILYHAGLFKTTLAGSLERICFRWIGCRYYHRCHTRCHPILKVRLLILNLLWLTYLGLLWWLKPLPVWPF